MSGTDPEADPGHAKQEKRTGKRGEEIGGEDYEEKNVESCTGRRYDSCITDRLRRFRRIGCGKRRWRGRRDDRSSRD